VQGKAASRHISCTIRTGVSVTNRLRGGFCASIIRILAAISAAHAKCVAKSGEKMRYLQVPCAGFIFITCQNAASEMR
jgi:hypothetical protein